MIQLAQVRIAVLGLGLMGGSFAAAMQGKCASIIGFDNRSGVSQAALDRGWIQSAAASPAEAVRSANLIILAAPVRAILSLLSTIGPHLPPDSLVLDLGSTKKEVTDALSRLPALVQVLGGHPMCGKETSGLDAADPTLFQNTVFNLVPLPRTSSEAIQLGCEVVAALGAKPLILQPEQHDQMVASVSHLPYLAACALVAAVADQSQNETLTWKVASSGFRDTSRLAASNVKMMLDILMTNREAVLQAVDGYRFQVDKLATLLRSGDEAALEKHLSQIQNTRKDWKP